MATKWFNKRQGSDLHESVEEAGMYLVGDPLPDWVRMPPELGSHTMKVEGAFHASCPLCGEGSPEGRHLIVEDGLRVAECPTHGFVWYSVSQKV